MGYLKVLNLVFRNYLSNFIRPVEITATSSLKLKQDKTTKVQLRQVTWLTNHPTANFFIVWPHTHQNGRLIPDNVDGVGHILQMTLIDWIQTCKPLKLSSNFFEWLSLVTRLSLNEAKISYNSKCNLCYNSNEKDRALNCSQVKCREFHGRLETYLSGHKPG